MARIEKRLPQNSEGEFFVDSTCIDCATCRRVAPKAFGRVDEIEQSYVFAQPQGDAERLRALMALVACPTASIGTVSKMDIRPALQALPEPVGDEIYYCGYTSESSFGASSYLIKRPRGNVLVDSPRAAGPLVKKLKEMGGVAKLFLTHKDDVADHEKFHKTFGCERILHTADVDRGTSGVERKVEGPDPVRIDDDLTVIPLPGHTRGSAALLYRDTALFTGDHLWWSDRLERLHASPDVCWYSWPEQIGSMERLLDFDFVHVLPGHGNRYRAESPRAMRSAIKDLIAWMHQSR